MNRLNMVLVPLAGALCLLPFVSAAQALIAGVVLALTCGNPYAKSAKSWTAHLLAISVMGLGFGMNLIVVAQIGLQGVGYTVVGIAGTFVAGAFLGRVLRTGRDISLLLTVGTAICGGSAIAAVASVIRPKNHDVTVALATVFMLNALALVIFPVVGHWLDLNQMQFGLWSALAIHDTSSVVGATMQYGPEALQIGTTVKLARALWIVPVALAVGWMRSRDEAAGERNFKKPWFILGFILAAALMTWVPSLQPVGDILAMIAKRLLVLTLFLIGASLDRKTLREVGFRPLVQGAGLWVIVSVVTLGAILSGGIS